MLHFTEYQILQKMTDFCSKELDKDRGKEGTTEEPQGTINNEADTQLLYVTTVIYIPQCDRSEHAATL